MRKVKIGDQVIGGKHHRVFFIADAGINHNGDIEKAKKLIQKAKWAGADAVKFQSFNTDNLWDRKETIKLFGKREGKEILALFDKVQLSRDDHFTLKEVADNEGIIFLSTPFDRESVDLLVELNVPAFKIASGDLTYHTLLEYVATKKLPVILSTGMAMMDEVTKAVEIFKKKRKNSLILLQCVSSYPAPYEEMNIQVIREYENIFSIHTGVSDHTIGTFVTTIAAAHGAKVIEKHFTLDRDDEGPDHRLSLNPDDLKYIISDIRVIEKVLGSKDKHVEISEIETQKIGRRGLYASRDIQEGEILRADHFVCKRPCSEIPANHEKNIYKLRAY